VTCGTWIGFDDRQTLGEKETGARAALPMWMDFMRAVIANKPNEAFATAGAPQKKLDVPLSSPADLARPLRQPVVKPDESDPDAPESVGDRPKETAPAATVPSNAPVATPNAAPDKPTPPSGPQTTAPVKSAPGIPASGATGSATSVEDGRSGVAKPPPDIE
jgi:penicillin-binding protein 1A